MELPEPFTGWTIDDAGTIHTPSGYRCTPQQIEAALWLVGSMRWERGKRVMFADTPLVEPRPRMYELRDLELPPARPIVVHREPLRDAKRRKLVARSFPASSRHDD